jgi:hypothetical protein
LFLAGRLSLSVGSGLRGVESSVDRLLGALRGGEEDICGVELELFSFVAGGVSLSLRLRVVELSVDRPLGTPGGEEEDICGDELGLDLIRLFKKKRATKKCFAPLPKAA